MEQKSYFRQNHFIYSTLFVPGILIVWTVHASKFDLPNPGSRISYITSSSYRVSSVFFFTSTFHKCIFTLFVQRVFTLYHYIQPSFLLHYETRNTAIYINKFRRLCNCLLLFADVRHLRGHWQKTHCYDVWKGFKTI